MAAKRGLREFERYFAYVCDPALTVLDILFIDDFVGEIGAFITYMDSGAGDEPFDLFLTLAAEVTLEKFFNIYGLSRTCVLIGTDMLVTVVSAIVNRFIVNASPVVHTAVLAPKVA